MRFTVVWSPEAEDELIQLWMAAPDRNRLTQVVNAIERQLARQPFSVGESRADNSQRVAFEPPIGMLFTIWPDDQIVRIVHIGWLPPPLRDQDSDR